MSFFLGLTGSIGMGKSTTATMFADLGVPVWDADAAVHRLYAKGGAAIGPIQDIVPAAIVDGAVDRKMLKEALGKDSGLLQKLEQVVHPLVAADRTSFIATQTAPVLLFDIPLLFETGADEWLNAVVVVTVAADVQRARVMAREGMTAAHFEQILSRQMPNADKLQRADYVIETLTMDSAQKQVAQVLGHIEETRLA